MKQVNSAGIKKEHVFELMMEDGNGPDEVLGMAEEYARAITRTKPSRTAVDRVKRHARAIIREARRQLP